MKWIALTATADEPTRAEIIEKLKLENARVFIEGFDRPNIQYRVELKANAKNQLLRFLDSQPSDASGIVYCLSRKKVEQIAEFLVSKGYKAYPYHAGLDTELRNNNQEIFLKEEAIIIVATIAFGMGIDKPDVRFVAHLDLPKSLEAYYQETGRAGRDGAEATAWMIYGLGDLITHKQMILKSEADSQRKFLEQQKLNCLLGYCETAECRRSVLLNYFGEAYQKRCGNCDSCLEPFEAWEGTREAQMALSAVYRTGQRFGVHYLVDLLRGESSERMERFGHVKLPIFAAGKSTDRRTWLSIYRQLVAAGFLSVDLGGFGGLILAEKSRAVLKGEEEVVFRKDREPAAKKAKKTKSRVSATSKAVTSKLEDSVAEELFKALKAKRLELAKEQGLPSYVIFHDKTLIELANSRPKTLSDMLSISGVGEHKLAKYGEEFLQLLKS